MHARFGLKLAAVFGVSTILISVFTIAMFYRQAVGAIRWEVETKMLHIAASSAQLVDPLAHGELVDPSHYNTPEYRNIENKLRAFMKSSFEIRHIYTLVADGRTGELMYVVDVGEKPPITAPIGAPWMTSPDRAAVRALRSGHPSVSTVVRQDNWGRYRSCFAPIKDIDGKTVAVLGMDMSVDRAIQQQHTITYGAVFSFLTACVLAVILAIAASSRISKPIMSLTAATQDIADGNLDCKLEIDSHDEIGSLAASFNSMVAALKEGQNVLMERANSDGLTGLYNHRYFHERLGQELKRSIRYGHPLSLLMIDLDGFKAINDRLGHPAGDTILRNVSKVISANIRETDIATRYGGDEFAIILPETELPEATAMAERIREIVDENQSAETDGKDPLAVQNQWKVTLSIGAAECPRHARHRDSLVAAADIAMYHAKHISQNRVYSYDDVPGAGGTMDPCRIHAFLQSASVSTIAALAEAVDVKDHYTHGHSESVAKYAVAAADQLRLSAEEKFNVRIAALLHDIGKIGMPDAILTNPGELSTEQRDIVRSHPSVGEKIVRQVPQLQRILPGILYHHERYDGKGYPSGLSGEKIPLIARIVCVADAFDAMTSNRPYREALSMQQAIAELRAGAGPQFDPKVVEALINWLESVELQVA